MKYKILLISIVSIALSNNIYAASDISKNNNSIITQTSDTTSKFDFVSSKNTDKTDKNSYIYLNDDGSYSIVNVGESIYVQRVDSDFNPIDLNKFRLSKPLFGGYYFDGENHYVITGENNENMSNKAELYTIDKYNLYEQKRGSVTITSEYVPIVNLMLTGGVELKRNGRNLSFADSVMLKKSELPFGKFNFPQRNIIFTFNMDNLSVEKPDFYGYTYSKNNVTDTSSQAFITYNDDNAIIVAQKDASGIYLTGREYTNNTVDKTVRIFEAYNKNTEMKNNSFTFDGLGISSNKFIAVGTTATQNSSYQTNNDFNIFISSLDITQLNSNLVKTAIITNYSKSDNVKIENLHLLETDNDSFILIWQELNNKKTTVKYAIIDSNGNIGNIKENNTVVLSNCKPVINNNKIVWFTVEKDNAAPKFYSIDI